MVAMAFVTGLIGVDSLLCVLLGPAFSGSPNFQCNNDRTDFLEPSRRFIAVPRSLLRLRSETRMLGVVSS